MNLRILLFFAFLVFGVNFLQAQRKETIIITDHNDQKSEYQFTVRYYKGLYIFPDDNKDFIKVKKGKESIKLPKSEIKKVRLQDGSEYIAFKPADSEDIFFGYYITNGKLKVFKTYSYGRVNTYGGPGTASQSINKVASLSFYLVEDEQLDYFALKSGIKELREDCKEFDDYVEGRKKKIKIDDLEEALIHYNEICQ